MLDTAMTDDELLDRYVIVGEFISKCFGDNVEVVIHDVRRDLNHSAVAVFNNHVSGREQGAPMTRLGCQFLAEKTYRHADHVCNYKGVTENGVTVRASTLFIKNARNRVIGYVCVNVDLTRYNQAIKMLQNLVHFEDGEGVVDTGISPATRETYARSAADRIVRAIAEYAEDMRKRPEHFTSNDKYAVISNLEGEGLFQIKGVIGDVASNLRLSEPTVYRYLKRIRKARGWQQSPGWPGGAGHVRADRLGGEKTFL